MRITVYRVDAQGIGSEIKLIERSNTDQGNRRTCHLYRRFGSGDVMRCYEAYRHYASQPDFRCQNTGDAHPSWFGAIGLVRAMFCASTALYLRPLKLDRCFGTTE